MKLHSVNHDLKTINWCGPAVLSAVLNKPTSEIVPVLKRLTGRSKIQGTSTGALRKTFNAYGYDFNRSPLEPKTDYTIREPWKSRPTLAAWLRQHRAALTGQVLVVVVGNHWIAVSGNTFVDNHTKDPVRLKKCPHRRARVSEVFVVQKNGQPQLPPPPAPKPPLIVCSANRLTVQQHQALRDTAAIHDITVESHVEISGIRGENWVYPPPVLDSEHLDPFYSEHLAYDWKETHERVREYARLATVVPLLLEQ